jgi:membrane protein implicated in regulation of membrane protease activity
MQFSWNWVLIIAGAALILLEVALGGFAGFDLVLIGSAFMIGGAIGLVVHDAQIAFVVASALCLLYIAIGRRWVRARMVSRPTASNVDALIGRQGVVVERVAPHAAGQVRVNDEFWRAEIAPGSAHAFEPGSLVTVAGISGVTLQVR